MATTNTAVIPNKALALYANYNCDTIINGKKLGGLNSQQEYRSQPQETGSAVQVSVVLQTDKGGILYVDYTNIVHEPYDVIELHQIDLTDTTTYPPLPLDNGQYFYTQYITSTVKAPYFRIRFKNTDKCKQTVFRITSFLFTTPTSFTTTITFPPTCPTEGTPYGGNNNPVCANNQTTWTPILVHGTLQTQPPSGPFYKAIKVADGNCHWITSPVSGTPNPDPACGYYAGGYVCADVNGTTGVSNNYYKYNITVSYDSSYNVTGTKVTEVGASTDCGFNSSCVNYGVYPYTYNSINNGNITPIDFSTGCGCVGTNSAAISYCTGLTQASNLSVKINNTHGVTNYLIYNSNTNTITQQSISDYIKANFNPLALYMFYTPNTEPKNYYNIDTNGNVSIGVVFNSITTLCVQCNAYPLNHLLGSFCENDGNGLSNILGSFVNESTDLFYPNQTPILISNYTQATTQYNVYFYSYKVDNLNNIIGINVNIYAQPLTTGICGYIPPQPPPPSYTFNFFISTDKNILYSQAIPISINSQATITLTTASPGKTSALSTILNIYGTTLSSPPTYNSSSWRTVNDQTNTPYQIILTTTQTQQSISIPSSQLIGIKYLRVSGQYKQQTSENFPATIFYPSEIDIINTTTGNTTTYSTSLTPTSTTTNTG